ncbi:MAG: flippase-like domain-containing protein [Deltaproteobacteria bacterium]|nr:flippase-like domain-containing protein [Deltaproteobacteria bacterium]MBW2662371.1 flippase-like domain-containing protein [Deltaproteobacteria bacterium]
MKNKLVSVLKWLWLISVGIFIIFFIQRNYEEMRETIRKIHIFYLVLSFLCIAGAKILLALFMRYAVRSACRDMDFPTCFRIYNISQLGKYIPGNIWHFIGKASAYKDRGFSMENIRDALVVENTWLVGCAFAYGIILMLIFNFTLIEHLFLSYGLYAAVFAVVALLMVLQGKKLLKIRFGRIFSDRRMNFKIILLQVVIWTLLGLGFFWLAIPFCPGGCSIFMVIGLYAMAFSIGFVTPFAPAGIGVREAVLGLGLLPYLPIDTVIVLSAANRGVYLVVEVLLALSSQAIEISRPASKI